MKIFYKVLIYLSIVIIALSITTTSTPNIFTHVFAQMMQQPQGQQQSSQQANNQTSLVLQDPSILQGSFFKIDNMTFSHQMASVNGIQMHYVIGGHGDPLVLLHGWPETWYEWHKVMLALAKNYTVIAPDLRGLGDSSKPASGYDGKTTAEDIYQLISQLGFNKIFLVGHDIGSQTAYSYAAAHPNNVSKLVIMEFGFPGFQPTGFENVVWWFAFHQTPGISEMLTMGKEREYLSWFYQGLAYNPYAITQADIYEFVIHYSSPGGMQAGFNYYKAFPTDAIENTESLAKNGKLQMPVLALGCDIYPAVGGDLPGNFALSSTQALASNVKGVTVPLSGHWLAEEQPTFVLKQLAAFFNER